MTDREPANGNAKWVFDSNAGRQQGKFDDALSSILNNEARYKGAKQ